MISSSNDYANALFMIAVEDDKLETFSSDLSVIKQVFRENPDYALLLTSPNIPKSERQEAVDAAFGGKVDANILNFIKVLCDHNKIDTLDDCIKDFKALKKSAQNRVTAKVYTAVPISEAQEQALKEKLQKKFGMTVKIKSVIDKNMLGGVRVEIDGKIIDGSVKRQLHDIKEVISG
ncbi:MAG: F0F1 ATP synthase subunit delta [Clostridia bacterium]|nr:F0F1 ATP synthase subunit delta [Clostridia bacterium]